MASYEQVIQVICENCYRTFINPFRIYTVTNVDYKSNLLDKLLTDNLNKATCPKCGAVFTYERPHLAYSLSKGYAVYSACNQDLHSKLSGRHRLYDMMSYTNMRYRLVDYIFEVAEKVRIFELGMDDISIEKVKHVHFGSEYFADKRKNVLLFKGTENDNMIFEYADFLGKVLETRKIPITEYPAVNPSHEPDAYENGFVVWTKIDNNYIKEILNG